MLAPIGTVIVPRSDCMPLQASAFQYVTKWSTTFVYLPEVGPIRVSGLTLQNASVQMAEFLEEVNHLTPKQVMFFDSRPLSGGRNPFVLNFIDTASHPNVMSVFLNPETATEPVVMHELGHAFVEYGLGIEDQREYYPRNDQARHLLVNCLQSSVMDLLVLLVLKQRGVDCSKFYFDIVKAAVLQIGQLKDLMNRSRYADVIAAAALAVPTAFPKLYELNDKDRELIKSLWTTCRLHDAKLAVCADRITSAMLTANLNCIEGVQSAIDKILIAAFDHIGEDFCLKRDLRPRQIRMEPRDKFLDFLPDASFVTKMGIIKEAIARRQNVRAYPKGNQAWVEFSSDEPFSALRLPKISRPIPLHPAEYSHNPEAMQKPVFTPMDMNDPEFTGIAFVDDPRMNVYLPQYELSENDRRALFMRNYMPDVGIFLSRDMVGRPGKNKYLYCSADPVNRIDTDGKDDKEVTPKLVSPEGPFPGGFSATVSPQGQPGFSRKIQWHCDCGEYVIQWIEQEYVTRNKAGDAQSQYKYTVEAFRPGANNLTLPDEQSGSGPSNQAWTLITKVKICCGTYDGKNYPPAPNSPINVNEGNRGGYNQIHAGSDISAFNNEASKIKCSGPIKEYDVVFSWDPKAGLSGGEHIPISKKK